MSKVVSLQMLKTKEFWRERVPHLNISDIKSNELAADVKQLSLSLNKDRFINEGYQQFDKAIDSKKVEALRDGIIALQKQDILPVFCMLYDEFWHYVSSVKNLIEEVLGENAQMLPDFWAWYIDPKKGQTGWPPHRDKTDNTLLDDGMPKSLTMWVSLTDATPENGCMYVVPANLDPHYRDFKGQGVPTNLQTVRALPAKAGSVFIWNQRVYHWGGASNKSAENPRISMAFEFQRGDIKPYNTPLLPLQTFPNFATRQKFVGKQILQYRHMYGFSADLTKIAESFLR